MEQFLTISTSFPVIVYTFLVAIIVIYWLLAMIGTVDIDMLDVDFDLDADVDMDVNAGNGLGADVDAEGLSGVTGFMVKWGLTGVPVTVVISVLVASAWLICYLGMSLAYALISWKILLFISAGFWLIFSAVLAVPVTGWFIKPMKKFFVSYTAAEKSSFVGKTCQVKTGKVTLNFGQAELEDGGAGMLFDVRADEAYGIKKGDWVIIVEYDEEDGSYLVRKTE